MTKQELIDAALLHYSKHGYQGATMRKIADEVGIKPASVYFFYENKESLFKAAFVQLLDNHFAVMKDVFQKNKDEQIEVIFEALLQAIVDHHAGDIQATIAYVSLVTSPIPEIKQDIQQYMVTYAEWLEMALEEALKKNYPCISSSEVNQIIKQFILLGNGIFWGINIYEEDTLHEQVSFAKQMMQSIFQELSTKYQ